MRNRPLTLSLLLVTAVALAGGAWLLLHRAAQPVQLALRFHPVVGAEPLVLGEARYANPGGEGRFEVRDFRLFISNIRLLGVEGEYAEPDSYHLLRFDGTEPGFEIVLRNVPRADYTRIEFGIGVDPAANGSITMRGDLDPNGRMAWSWDVGYKFVLFEGTLLRGDTRQPLVYHVGFDENYRVVSRALDAQRLEGGRLDFRVDVLAMFGGEPPLDMAALSTVKFDRADAARLAQGFAGMVSTPAFSRIGQ
jgi:hypothetical protein